MKTLLLTLLFSLVFSALSSSAQLTPQMRVDLVDQNVTDVQVVISPAKPTGLTENLILEELWRIGGEEEDSLPMGFIRQVLLHNNMIYILDTKESKIYVVELNGRLRMTIDTRGQGPGECDNPGNFLTLGDGSFLLLRSFPAHFIQVKLPEFPPSFVKNHTGKFIEISQNKVGVAGAATSTLTGISGTKNQGKQILAFAETQNFTNNVLQQDRRLATFSSKGVEGVHYFAQQAKLTARDKVPSEGSTPYYFYQTSYTILEDGRVQVAPYRDQYLIYQFLPNGELEKVFGRQYQPRKRTETEKKLISYASGGGESFQMDVEEFEADILGIDNRGSRLLVRTSRSDVGLPHGVYRQYDVFENGQFTHHLNLHAPGNAQKDEVRWLGDELLAVIKGNFDAQRKGVDSLVPGYNSDAVEVILYRVKKN